ncbi:MAG: hypothetical protein KIG94_01220 [Acetatifactor sp.]|nr:hypothetical protein [Acetatifactor sp.]
MGGTADLRPEAGVYLADTLDWGTADLRPEAGVSLADTLPLPGPHSFGLRPVYLLQTRFRLGCIVAVHKAAKYAA